MQIPSYVAQSERGNIRQRQTEGIASAKERGVRFGRQRMMIPPEFEAAKAIYNRKELSSRKAVNKLGISQNTFLQWVEDYSPIV